MAKKLTYQRAAQLATVSKSLSSEDVREILDEYERKHPNNHAEDLTPKEFADLCIRKMKMRGLD
jgi:hypothetical protein